MQASNQVTQPTFAHTVSVQYAVTEVRGIPTRATLKRWALATLCQSAVPTTLTLRVVDADEGRQLNAKFRGKDYATNVLTFAYGIDPDSNFLSADIVLCAPVIADEAHTQQKTLRAHYAHMLVHGVLHAQGYDHLQARDAALMETLEIGILHELGYANPYLLID